MWMLAIALGSGCAEPAAFDSPAPGEARTPLDKADVFGSCEGSDCNGPSDDGTCYCDPHCDEVGDCCDDKVELCDATCGSFKVEFEAAIGTGSGLSRIDLFALGAGTGHTDKPLGSFQFLSAEFQPKQAKLTKALAMSDNVILKFTGNRAQVRNLRMSHNGSVVYFADATAFSPTAAAPRYAWIPAAAACEGAIVLPEKTPTTVTVDNQATLRVDTPKFKDVFVWAGVTDTSCAGTDTGAVELRWAEDDAKGALASLNKVSRSDVLQDLRITTKPGAAGLIWLTSTRGRNEDPGLPDGSCEITVYTEYR